MAVEKPCQGDPDGLPLASGLDRTAPQPRDLHLGKKSRKM
jgi:hypothetical protein